MLGAIEESMRVYRVKSAAVREYTKVGLPEDAWVNGEMNSIFGCRQRGLLIFTIARPVVIHADLA